MTDQRTTADTLFEVSGKVALITGATSGIGRMMAEALVARGVRVYVVARNAEDCAATAGELAKMGECIAIPGDLSTVEGIARIAASFAEREERLDVLVNNAGLFSAAPIEEYSEDLWDYTSNLNLKAAFFLIQKLLPSLRRAASARDPARIINIGSGHGIRPSRFDSFAYQATKAALHHLTRHLAGRLAPDHITVNAIAPGVYPSRNTAHFDQATVDAIIANVPLGRYGEADDIAGAIIFLCSRAGAYVSAAVLPVDGGWAGGA